MMRKTVLSGWFPVVVTVRLAALLVTLPAALLTTTVNWSPLSEAVVAGVVSLAAVAPPIAVPFFCDGLLMVVVSGADAVMVVACPVCFVCLMGWAVIGGGSSVVVTVRAAALLVTLPTALLTTTVN